MSLRSNGKAVPTELAGGPQALIGLRVGNYRIKEKVGEGAMAAVYLAEHVQLDRNVAMKVLHPHLHYHPTMGHRLSEEARITSTIHHPNVVEVLDVGELPGGVRYFAMEWLEGRTLGYLHRTEPPRFPVWRALHIARGVAQALGAAHQRGIVHRDLKPENIFLVCRENDADFVKVVDFGIATSLVPAPVERRSETGMVLGTPCYMSPEQCRGAGAPSQPIDGRSDLYSLGVILYELLTGRLPFDAEQLGDLILAHLTLQPTPPRSIDPTIPEEIEAIVLRLLEKDPAHRFQSAEALLEALRGHELPPGAMMRTFAPPHEEEIELVPVERSRRGIAALGIGVAVLLATAFFALRSPHTVEPPKAAAASPADTARAEAPSPIVPPAPPVSALAPEPPRPAAPSAEKRATGAVVNIEIRATPAEAELLVDGERVANPYRTRSSPSDWNHLIEARAPGHKARTTGLLFDRDRRVTLALSPESPAPVVKNQTLIMDYPQ